MIIIDAVKTGENLRKLMAEKGLDHVGLSRAAGAHRDSVHPWLTGEKLPSLDHMLSIAVELGIPMASILAVTMDDGADDSLEGGTHGDC